MWLAETVAAKILEIRKCPFSKENAGKQNTSCHRIREIPTRRAGVGMLKRPLLVYISAGISQHAVVKVGMIPGHDQCARTAGAAAHRRAASGSWVNFTLAAFSASGSTSFSTNSALAGHGVVFEAALAALGVAAAVADGDVNHHRHPALAIRLSRAVNISRSVPSVPTINGAAVPGTYSLGHKPKRAACREQDGWW